MMKYARQDNEDDDVDEPDISFSNRKKIDELLTNLRTNQYEGECFRADIEDLIDKIFKEDIALPMLQCEIDKIKVINEENQLFKHQIPLYAYVFKDGLKFIGEMLLAIEALIKLDNVAREYACDLLSSVTNKLEYLTVKANGLERLVDLDNAGQSE